MDHKFELQPLSELREEYWMHALFSVITGLDYDEIDRVIKKKRCSGQEWISMVRDLGFNVSPRWKSFDPETIYPCIIRCHHRDANSSWYPFIYYDDKVYAPHHGGTYDSLSQFLNENDYFRITSMIQVWI